MPVIVITPCQLTCVQIAVNGIRQTVSLRFFRHAAVSAIGIVVIILIKDGIGVFQRFSYVVWVGVETPDADGTGFNVVFVFLVAFDHLTLGTTFAGGAACGATVAIFAFVAVERKPGRYNNIVFIYSSFFLTASDLAAMHLRLSFGTVAAARTLAFIAVIAIYT